jgi:hypothetical protein
VQDVFVTLVRKEIERRREAEGKKETQVRKETEGKYV